jgi:signal transduction histidine kinase/DNA-binding NarL/FixJ family response regulator
MRAKNETGFLAVLAVSFMVFGVSCTGHGRDTGVQNIALQWTAIERALLTGDPPCADSPVIEAIGVFYDSVRRFIDAEVYQMHHMVAPAPRQPAFDFLSPGDLPEIRELANLVSLLRLALLDGEGEKARRVSADISGVVLRAAMREASSFRFLSNQYSVMLWILGIIFVFAVFVTMFFRRMLVRSQTREEEGWTFSRSILMAQEDERKRISLELHDTVVQDLRFLHSEMDRIVTIDDKTEREKLYTEASSLHSTLNLRLRDICSNLIPPDFGLQELPDTLRRLCLDFGKRHGIACRMEMADPGFTNRGFPDRETKLQIFRIVQEALANVGKHANAREAVVALDSGADGSLVIDISDDGVGYKPDDSKPGAIPADGKRLGIRGMTERATLLGGSINIDNNSEEGTRVRVFIPPSPYRRTQAHGAATMDVLLIDDHPVTNRGIASWLEQKDDFRMAQQVNTLGEARRFIEDATEATGKLPSLIVLDIQLGMENGLDFIPFLQDHCLAKGIAAPPVLVCSAHDDPFRMEAAIKMGAAGYLTKGGNAREMQDAVETVMRGEVYVPAEHAAALKEISGRYGQLSAREFEIAAMVRQGKTSRQIAAALDLSTRTVETHLGNIYNKTGTGKRSQLQDL